MQFFKSPLLIIKDKRARVRNRKMSKSESRERTLYFAVKVEKIKNVKKKKTSFLEKM